MARGYPDYSGALQFPARKIQQAYFFPTANIAAGGTAILLDVSGQGEITGGMIRIVGTADLSLVETTFIVDSESLVESDFSEEGLVFLDARQSTPLYLTVYDPDDFEIVYGLRPGYYWGDMAAVTIHNGSANIISVVSAIYYSFV
jgi:hypothetical protein